MEKTLVLIKPDAVERNHIGSILSIYEENNLKILNLKMLTCSKDLAKKHYAEHIGKPFFEKLITYITRSPLVAVILVGENAIVKVRKLNGTTSPDKANKTTIRGRFAISGSENSVHGSDSLDSATREIKLWFG